MLKCVHIFWDTRCIPTYFLHKSSALLHDHPIASCPYLRQNLFLTTKLFLILRVRLFWPVAQLHTALLTVNRLWPPALRLQTLLSAVMKPVSPLAINWLRWCRHGLTVQTPINRQEISVSCLTVHATAFPQFQTVFRSNEICKLDRMVGTTGEGRRLVHNKGLEYSFGLHVLQRRIEALSTANQRYYPTTTTWSVGRINPPKLLSASKYLFLLFFTYFTYLITYLLT